VSGIDQGSGGEIAARVRGRSQGKNSGVKVRGQGWNID